MADLTPPDREQCQAEIREAQSFMTIGPRPKHKRCTNKPVCILTEKTPGADGQLGAMSLCGDCFVQFCIQDDPSRVTVEKING